MSWTNRPPLATLPLSGTTGQESKAATSSMAPLEFSRTESLPTLPVLPLADERLDDEAGWPCAKAVVPGEVELVAADPPVHDKLVVILLDGDDVAFYAVGEAAGSLEPAHALPALAPLERHCVGAPVLVIELEAAVQERRLLQLLVRPGCRPDAVDERCRGRTRGGGRLSSAPPEADAGEHVGERRPLRCRVLLLRVQPRTEPDEEDLIVELHDSETKTQIRLQPEAVFGGLIHVRASE